MKAGVKLVVGIAIAGAAVAWADVALLRLFLDEKADARERVALERRVIEGAARSAIVDALRAALARAELEAGAVFDDPLRDDLGLVEIYDGKQTIPRVAPGHPEHESGDRSLYEVLKNGGPIRVDSESIRAQIDAVRAVQQAKTGEELTAAVRAFLAQRANSRFFVKYDLPAALVVAEVLAARDDVDPALLHALLREGRQVGTSKIVPIQAQLIERARDLREEDARFLFDRVVEVSERAGVSTLALRARWEELAAPLDLPLVVEGERVFAGLVWAARSRPAEKAWSGVRVPEGRILDDVRADLRARSVLRDDDDIALSVPRDGAAPSDLDVLVRSPRLEGEAALAASRFRVKSGLLGTFTLMAGALVAGLVLDARRRKRYDELRSGFVAAVSHELRTPLASMRLLVESMIARAGDDKTREKLERLGGDVDGLDFLVENILSFSRLERGRLVPRKERVSLVEVAADAAQRARAECPGVVVTVDAADAADVDGDPELLALVVHHLVRNAWQHNPRADRKVSVVVRARAVSVEDNGPGVPEGDRERIFLEFERGRQPSSRGTGLGLALCRQIARAHGGDVTLASTGPGGSTFLLAV